MRLANRVLCCCVASLAWGTAASAADVEIVLSWRDTGTSELVIEAGDAAGNGCTEFPGTGRCLDVYMTTTNNIRSGTFAVGWNHDSLDPLGLSDLPESLGFDPIALPEVPWFFVPAAPANYLSLQPHGDCLPLPIQCTWHIENFGGNADPDSVLGLPAGTYWLGVTRFDTSNAQGTTVFGSFMRTGVDEFTLPATEPPYPLCSDIALGQATLSLAGPDASGPLGTLGAGTLTHAQLTDAGNDDDFGDVLAVGDFNGDGHEDIAIGDPSDDTSATNQGAVHIIYGSSTGPDVTTDQTLRQAVGGVSGTAELNDYFGAALAVGRFNDDIYDDLAVGVPGESIGATLGAGQVIVFYGSATGLRTDNEQYWSLDSAGISGVSQAGDAFGAALAAADFDGSVLYDDLVIGIPGLSAVATDGGRVMLLPGSFSGLTSVEEVWEEGWNGVCCIPDAGDNFGESLVAGDFDNDGYPDLVIGVPGNGGSIHILEGSSTGLAWDKWWNQNTPGIPGSIQTGSRWGHTLAACDFDGDFRDDLALGALTSDSSGIVQVHPGSAAGLTPGPTEWKQGANVPGTAIATDRFGDALACGDFDNDGYADLAIATPYEDELSSGSVTDGGHIDVIYGSATGLDAANIQEWDRGYPAIGAAPAANDHWGTALAVADFDNNGHDDLAVGMVPSTADGEVDLLYGGISPAVPALPVAALALLAGALGAVGARRAWIRTR